MSINIELEIVAMDISGAFPNHVPARIAIQSSDKKNIYSITVKKCVLCGQTDPQGECFGWFGISKKFEELKDGPTSSI